MTDKEKTERAPQSKVPTFTKEQFLASRQRPGHERDILAAVLEDGKTYTLAEAEKALQAYLKRSVK
jgi:hypothetical protein